MSRTGGAGGRPHHVVLAVENMSVPSDKRVWNEARMLRDAGYRVTVIGPTGEDGRDPELALVIDDITVWRYHLPRASDSATDYVVEYGRAMWHTARILARLDGPVAVFHSANPPDFLLFAGLVAKLRWRSKLVFDHHDLSPELFESRFGGRTRIHRLLVLAERATFALADAVVSTNESYRSVAMERGRKDPEQVRVVRNARERAAMAGTPDPGLRRGRRHLAVFVGLIGHQDGGQDAVRVAAEYRHSLGRNDLQIAIVGDGDALPDCRALADELGVADMIDFAGWQETDGVRRYLASADIGLATDPPSPLNNRSTMIKMVEYLAAGLPVVSFDLPESMVSAGDAALYAPGGEHRRFAELVAQLLDEPDKRTELTRVGLQRTAGPLSWETARAELLATYDQLLGD